jgi:hypothetical protein
MRLISIASALTLSAIVFVGGITASSASTSDPAATATPAIQVTPDKGGPAAACHMMTLNQRLHATECNPHLDKDPAISARCAKMAVATGMIAAGSVAVATTPLDWPGVVLTGSFTVAGTLIFCEADWL